MTGEEKGIVDGCVMERCPVVLELRNVFKSQLGGEGLCGAEFPGEETKWRHVRLINFKEKRNN